MARWQSSSPYLREPRVLGHGSYWLDSLRPMTPRPGLPGDVDVDVAVVGAGFTGLWTAYYLLQGDPSLRVAVIEKEFAGFGASGRNGGWLSAEPPGDMTRYAAHRGRPAAIALQRAMFETIDEVAAVARRHGIDASVRKDGVIHFATNAAQLTRLHDRVRRLREWGWTSHDLTLLDLDDLAERVRIAHAVGGVFTPHGARIHPGRLVRGLAEVVEGMGATIHEETAMTSFGPRRVETDRGRVRSRAVVIALEGYLSRIRGYERRMLPMNSSMIITEPLSDEAWDAVAWRRAETIGDAAHGFSYLQRTDDRRIALGGRGVPYNFRSSFDWDGRTQPRAVQQLVGRLHALFPATRTTPIAHSWTGVLGVPRDWSATVSYDATTGIGMAGGYVGHGVAATNLAGRTLADLVLGRSGDLTASAWLDRRPRAWEPEPLRWLGASALYRAYRAADAWEARSGTTRTSPLARVADVVAGR